MTIVKAGPAGWAWSGDVAGVRARGGRRAVSGRANGGDAGVVSRRGGDPRVGGARSGIKEFDGIRWEVFVPEDQVGDFLETTKRLGREFYRVCPPGPRCV